VGAGLRRGLLGPGERKSVQPLAARVAPNDHEQLHHFVCTSCWDPAPLERVLAEEAQRLVGGAEAVLIVDDTTLLKQGKHSVGVARQYSGAAGKTTNCQTLVSLTLARWGIRAVIPRRQDQRPGGRRRRPFDRAAYRKRNRVERLINRLKQRRRVGTRYEKRAAHFLAMLTLLTLAAVSLWL
jgi:SRSO17 transposase